MIVALVLLSAFLHAAWNAMLRAEPDRDRTLVVAVAVATAIAAAVAIVRVAAGAHAFTTTASLAWSVAGGLCEFAYFFALAKALDRGALAPVYTVSRGGAIIVVWPLSIAFAGEQLTRASAIGSAIVIVGLMFASRRGAPANAAAPTTSRAALAWALACACAIAGYHLAYKGALVSGANPSCAFAVALALATALNVARLGADNRRAAVAILRARWPRVLAMGALCAASFLILIEALARGGAGFVLTSRNTSVLFATGLAALVGDRPRRTEIVGAVLVAAGAIAMGWS